MKKTKKFLALTAVIFFSTCCQSLGQEKEAWQTTPGLYGVLDTSAGRIVCQLFEDKAPKTVANFVGLAEGTKEWTDPQTGKKQKRPFYDGLIFHRIIPKFMVQGGDPTGTGRGGPGYRFEDEFHSALKFDQPGRLAMANAGPNTNGSQFFITSVPTPWLDGRHTIFGQVVQGQEIIAKIEQVQRNRQDRPLKDVTITKLTIKRILKK